MSTQWNQKLSRCAFSNVIECLEQNTRKQIDYKRHPILNKWTEYKIFKLKYANTRLLGNTKYNQVKSVLAVFASAY